MMYEVRFGIAAFKERVILKRVVKIKGSPIYLARHPQKAIFDVLTKLTKPFRRPLTMATRAVTAFALASMLLLNAKTSFAQAFEGGFVYQNSSTNNQEGYYFRKDGEFSWFKITTNGKELGTGNYTVTHDSLQLNFHTAQRQFDIQAQSSFKARGSNSTIRVNAMRSTGAPFPGLKFVLLKSNIKGETDLSGTTEVAIPTSRSKRDNIHFEVDGYRTINLPIDLDGMSHFYAVVIDDAVRYRENVTARFKRILSRRTLTLTGSNGEMIFKKTKHGKFMDLFHGV